MVVDHSSYSITTYIQRKEKDERKEKKKQSR